MTCIRRSGNKIIYKNYSDVCKLLNTTLNSALNSELYCMKQCMTMLHEIIHENIAALKANKCKLMTKSGFWDGINMVFINNNTHT